MGCELPPDEVLASTTGSPAGRGSCAGPGWTAAWTRSAPGRYLDLLLNKDSRPRRHPRRRAAPGQARAGPGPGGPGRSLARPGRTGRPAGFASRVTLTVPLATVTGLADRPGELAGIGPVDPWLARDLASRRRANPKTTWCLTVTDQHGHAVGHGCARPEPRRHRKRAGPGPPGRFTFTPASRGGPPGGYGTWRLRTPGPGPDLIINLDPGHHRPLRPPLRNQRPRPRGQAPAPVQIRHATCTSPICRRPAAQCRLRAQHPVRSRRTDVPLQRRAEVPSRPSAQTAPQVEGRPAPGWYLPLDHPFGADLRHRTHPVPHLTRRPRAILGMGDIRPPTAAIAGNSRFTRCWPTRQIPFATWMKSIILAGIVLICGRRGPGR